MIENHLRKLLEIGKQPSSIKSSTELEWYHLFDQCVWDVIVCSEEELLSVFNKSWAFDLPVPIHTLICQRLYLISKDSKIKEESISLARAYCNPQEESNVKLGVD